MSRKIDMSNPKSWSEEDIRYLEDRGLITDQMRQDLKLGAPEHDQTQGAGPTGTPNIQTTQPTPSGVELEDMTKAELIELAESQGVESSGNKADIIERLRTQTGSTDEGGAQG